MQLVVLAGGLGTRLRDVIDDDIPKPMAPVDGRPFLERVLERTVPQGIDAILLLVGYKSEPIRRHFGSAFAGIPIAYSAESMPLGTGGAVAHAADQLEAEFVLTNGDTYAEVDLPRLVALRNGGLLSMTVAEVPDISRYGTVETDGRRVIRIVEKGREGRGMINAGTYSCHRDILSLFPMGERSSFENDVLEPHVPEVKPPYLVTSSPMLDIGVPDDYASAPEFFATLDRALDH